MEIKIKKIYEQRDLSDGYRILVDRIWPRGLTKEKANCTIDRTTTLVWAQK